MNKLTVRWLNSPGALRRAAGAWNDLWLRSEVTRPTARAEMVALWCECFAWDRPLVAIVVERNGTLLAALPIVAGRVWGVRAGLPADNAWSPAGELLLDKSEDPEFVCDALLHGLREVNGGLLWLDAIRMQSDSWQLLLDAARHSRFSSLTTQSYAVARVAIDGDWAGYLASRSRNHRHQLKAIGRRAAKLGVLELERLEELAPEQVEGVLHTCFDIEARGWKGDAAGAVLRVPGMWEFFLEQARQLAARRELSISLLRLDGEPIAYEYGWIAKRELGVLKVAYDESQQRLSPGQLLRCQLIEQLHQDRSVDAIDYLGPVTKATSHWATEEYVVGRVMIALSGLPSRAAIAAYQHVRPALARWRKSLERTPVPPAAAEPPPASEQEQQLEEATVE